MVFERPPGTHELTRSQRVPRSPGEVFEFFTDPGNLARITPPHLHFRIVSGADFGLGRGSQLDFRLRLRGIPIRWRTLISAWEPGSRVSQVSARDRAMGRPSSRHAVQPWRLVSSSRMARREPFSPW